MRSTSSRLRSRSTMSSVASPPALLAPPAPPAPAVAASPGFQPSSISACTQSERFGALHCVTLMCSFTKAMTGSAGLDALMLA